MSVSRLEDLPADILRLIHDYLDDEHPPSLLSLAFSSKRCYISAAYRLNRELRISFSGSLDPTDDDVRKCTQGLEGSTFLLGYVRRLIIVDGKYQPTEECEARFIYRNDRVFNSIFGICTDDLTTHGADPDEIYMPLRSIDANPDNKMNFPWRPVAELLEKLGNLTELVFDGPQQFPNDLLEALHRFQPACKLYINHFWLKAFHTGRISGYERKLVTSPCLYGIRVLYDGTDGQYAVSKSSARSIAKIVATLSPNLKNVIMRDVGQATKWNLLGGMRSKNGYTRGSLESLTLGMCHGTSHWELDPNLLKLTKNVIKNWAAITDFTVLETLDLLDPLDMQAIALLASCSFPRLKNLGFSFGPVRPSRRWITKSQRFFTTLPSLSTLRLSDWSADAFPLRPTLDRHARGLYRLVIFPTPGAYLTTTDIAYLSEGFLSLVELSVPTQRTRGDAAEIFGYTMLGALPNLRYLNLELCTLPRIVLRDAWYGRLNIRVDRTWSQFRREYHDEGHEIYGLRLRKGHVMEILTNSAVDEALACDIFEAIQLAKPRDAVPLKRLRLEVNRSSLVKVKGPVMQTILRTLSPRWSIEFVSPERGWAVRGEEACSHAEKTHTFYGVFNSHRVDFFVSYEPILRLIWPAIEESAVWWDAWESIPLSRL